MLPERDITRIRPTFPIKLKVKLGFWGAVLVMSDFPNVKTSVQGQNQNAVKNLRTDSVNISSRTILNQ